MYLKVLIFITTQCVQISLTHASKLTNKKLAKLRVFKQDFSIENQRDYFIKLIAFLIII